jgi:hypothetical protein
VNLAVRIAVFAAAACGRSAITSRVRREHPPGPPGQSAGATSGVNAARPSGLSEPGLAALGPPAGAQGGRGAAQRGPGGVRAAFPDSRPCPPRSPREKSGSCVSPRGPAVQRQD